MEINRVLQIAKEVAMRSRETGKHSLFSIANTANGNNAPLLFPSIRETEISVCGNVLVRSMSQVEQIIAMIDGVVDFVLVDAETKVPNLENMVAFVGMRLRKSRLLTFKPNDFTVDALDVLVAQCLPFLHLKKIAVIGTGNIGAKAALKFFERGAHVVITRRNEEKLKKIAQGFYAMQPVPAPGRLEYTTDNLKACLDADVVIGASAGTPVITTEMVRAMKPEGFLVDVGNGTLFQDALHLAHQSNMRVVCLNMRPGYEGALTTLFKTEKIVENFGKRSLNGFAIIAGGYLGERGDVIVDNVQKPTKIFAIADGKGDVIADLRDPAFQENIRQVETLLTREITV